ncbi:MAG: hypothetical protein PHF86_04515 [Candidatus Nanoarchaeia archaeon]|jgi:hypothetical protein|nr:hypothetical protein [Candidatus Nanoarchaeia archaeon]
MLRVDESNVLAKAMGLPITKKATYFERISFNTVKKDPFEGKTDNNVWKMQGNKLLKKKSS